MSWLMLGLSSLLPYFSIAGFWGSALPRLHSKLLYFLWGELYLGSLAFFQAPFWDFLSGSEQKLEFRVLRGFLPI